MDVTKTRAKRASKPKVRTGCVTCRARHVKCDETLPECHKCSGFGRKCGGYLSTTKRVAILPRSQQHVLLPRARHESKKFPTALAATVQFSDETEHQYFRLFQDEIAGTLSGGFDATVWNRILLSACDKPAIRQLSIATAALRKAKENTPTAVSAFTAKYHQDYALKQYGKALRGIQGLITKHGEQGLRTALLAALMIFCFEMMLGKSLEAVTQLRSAISLIHTQLCHDPKSIRWTKPYVSRDVSLGLRPSLPFIMEDEILEQYASLDRSVVGLIASYFPPFHDASLSMESRLVAEKFVAIKEAKEALEFIKSRLPGATEGMKFSSRYWPPSEACTALEGADHMRRSLMVLRIHPSSPSILLKLDHWIVSFSPLLQEARSSTLHPNFIAATTLYITAETLHLGLESGTTAHKLNGKCRTIISYARSLVRHPQYARSFVFEAGIIPYLWFVVVMCPDLELKQEAVQLLKDMSPRVECATSSVVCARHGQALVDSIKKQENLLMYERAGHADGVLGAENGIS